MYIYHALNILTLSPKEKCNNKGTAPVPAAELTPALLKVLYYIEYSPRYALSYSSSNSNHFDLNSIDNWQDLHNLSNTGQSKVTPVKTYSEAVSASEGTRSEPNKTAKAAPRKPKKQFKSPEEVPSEWDESNLSSKSETRKTAATVVKKPVKSTSRPKTLTSNGPISPPAIPAERPDSAEKSQATALPTKKKPTVPAKSNNPLPITDPFKSNEKPSKLIDKDSISHLSFKKLDREPLAKTVNNAAETSIDQVPRKKEAAVRVDSLSEAAKTLLNGPGTFKEPIDRLTQKSLDNYFVPQGRTGVKLNQEYFRRAEKTKDEDLKVVALRSASELQTDLLRSITQEEFQKIFHWDPKSEFDEYLNTQKGRTFLKERGAEVTPTPPPEVQMQPPEATQSQPRDQPTETHPQMYYHPNGCYYPYPPTNTSQQNQYCPQQDYNQNYSTYQQGYYPPQQWVNNQVPQKEQSVPHQETRKKVNGQAPKSNRNRPRNRKEKGPSWVPPPNSNRVPPDSNSMSTRERRRRAHQLSIHQEMIRLSRTTQAQYQALESMRNQNAGGGSRHQPREDAQTPRN
ncbi:uncharacterized protein PGTG_21503 [Puccinia graminis f. sp. tritici CRL 75-36-700-3]|uniref:Uncharacterized protein n=1 Tax=Puccinia graminis f. sp. tritici (strain CRL 75-36-700-3 / race SCCL) TaxID=418459 RepID=H6QRL7_PUCGT|nr:uncharacterized protein PGTG_21503 [Puccinia graminis f. sp. tritici CRL 75-36-700-3]EHS63287.1 hypothetical protein PGTG_21503 [Puccinia graminis f. sp. tritici CRL 75-36-700-3]